MLSHAENLRCHVSVALLCPVLNWFVFELPGRQSRWPTSVVEKQQLSMSHLFEKDYGLLRPLDPCFMECWVLWDPCKHQSIIEQNFFHIFYQQSICLTSSLYIFVISHKAWAHFRSWNVKFYMQEPWNVCLWMSGQSWECSRCDSILVSFALDSIPQEMLVKQLML